MRATRWGVVLQWAVVCSVAAGCVTRNDPPPSKLAEGCLLTSDCENPLVCVFRRCYQQCTSDRDCPSPGGRCQAAEAPYAVCIDDCTTSPCPTGFTCGDDKRCRKGCGTFADCLAGQSCLSGQCVSPLDISDAGAPISRLCAVDSQCAVGEVCRRNGTCGPQCLGDRDCGSAQTCVAGACALSDGGQSGGGCLYNSDCMVLDEVCRSGVCQAECTKDRDCGSGLTCDPVKRRCVGNDAGCTLDTQCGTQVCLVGQCRAECVQPRDCATNFTCTGGSCRRVGATSDGGACLYSSNCAPGEKCSGGSCVAECNTSLDCTSGLACQNGRCVLPTSDAGVRGCIYSSDCNAGERCSPQGFCIPECVSTRDCAAPQVCTAGRCVFQSNDGGVACVYNSQCAAGQRCASTGSCVSECVTTRDCASPLICANGSCVIPVTVDGGVVGLGTPCVLQSTCSPFGLVCTSGVCTVECVADPDCSTASGQCCSSNRCVAGNACAVAVDGGAVTDAGTVGPGGACRASIDCIDAYFCNGQETCVQGRCVPGTNPCDDTNPCTIDSCDEARRQCSYTSQAIDQDLDQHYPVQCGGTADDCDDTDPFTFPGAIERCDFKDNNCNGAVDEGLWREVPASRGVLSTGGQYPGTGGVPAAVRVGADVVVLAASNGVRGSLDAFRLNGADFSFRAGPVVMDQSATAWNSCSFNSSSFLGRQVVRPSLSTDGAEVAASAIIGSQTNAQATCCSSDPLNVRTSVTFAPLALTGPTVVGLRTLNAYSSSCGVLLSRSDYVDLDRPAMAFSAALNATVAVWLEERPANASTGIARSVLFSTLSRTQPAATPREVWSVAPNPASITIPSNQSNFMGPRVAVGANTVLFAWTNDSFQPIAGRRIRWVLYDANLTSVVAGPGDYVFPFATPANLPQVDAVVFDGAAYQLLVNPRVPPSGNADGLARLLTVSESGALLGARPVMSSNAGNSSSTFPSAASSLALTRVQLDGGAGYAVVGSRDSFLRLGTLAANPDSGVGILEVDLGIAPETRTDFAIAPLDNGRLGVVWSDGDLNKTVLRCGP